jgi:hypothetical protein
MWEKTVNRAHRDWIGREVRYTLRRAGASQFNILLVYDID